MSKILVIDDEAIILNAMTLLLQSENHEVITASEAESGVGLFREQKPDAVFLDLKLEGKNGIEVLGEILEIDPSAKVIIITGYPSPEIKAEVMKKGAFFFYEKNRDVAELLQALHSALGTKATSPKTPEAAH